MSETKKQSSFVADAIRLMFITLIAGLLLGVVYYVTYAPIQESLRAATIQAYKQVFPDAADFTDNPDAASLISASEADIAAQGFGNGVIDAKDASGNVIGHVINSTSKDGFGGWVSISTGIQEDGTLNGIAFLSISESAGLGMNARDTDWYKQFTGKKADKFSVTKTGATSDDEINAISGATITSRAVTGAVNAAVYFVNNHLK